VPDQGVSDAAFQRIELEQARAALDTLSPDQREVIALVVLDGMSYAEAAATLEIPVGTVMSRLARARGALVSKLAREVRPKLAKPP